MNLRVLIFACLLSLLLITIVCFKQYLPCSLLLLSSFLVYDLCKKKWFAVILCLAVIALLSAKLLTLLWLHHVPSLTSISYITMIYDNGKVYPLELPVNVTVSGKLLLHYHCNCSMLEAEAVCAATTIIISGYNWQLHVLGTKLYYYNHTELVCAAPLKLTVGPLDNHLQFFVLLNMPNKQVLEANITVPVEFTCLLVPANLLPYVKAILENPQLLEQSNNPVINEAQQIILAMQESAAVKNEKEDKLNFIKFYLGVFLMFLAAVLACYYIIANRKS